MLRAIGTTFRRYQQTCTRGTAFVSHRNRLAPTAISFFSSKATDIDAEFISTSDTARRELHLIQDVVNGSTADEDNAKVLEELRAEATKPDLWDDPSNASSVLQRLGALESRAQRVQELEARFNDTNELFELAKEEDDSSVKQDTLDSMTRLSHEAQQLRVELLLSRPSDLVSCFIELQAGAGGTESCDWVAMLSRMYARWGESRSYRVQTVDSSPGDEAGFRAVTLRLDGAYAYGWAKTEAGVHRLVRVSPFDSAGRRHTSFAQVRVYPLVPASGGKDEIEISTSDLRIDTFRSSGAGGQHVNTTDSAVRITHIPSGIVTQSQSERSQHRNKAEAMDMLRAKLYQQELEKQAQARQEFTQGLGENAWGSQIRSYVLHPYKQVKDHRTKVTMPDTKQVLDGNVDKFMEAVLLSQAN